METLRRPGGYVAALIVGIVAVATGLPWWAGLVTAVLALGIGYFIAAALARRTDGVSRTTARGPAVPGETASATFRLEGEYWTLTFRGPAFRMHDTKGLRYIHRLLETPGVEVHALDLVQIGQTAPPTVTPALEDDLHPVAPSDQPLLDREAIRRYRLRIEDLRDQIQESEANNDPERGARAREELESILDQIERDTGHGREPRFQAEAEKSRLNVTRAIKSAITRVRNEDASLGHHLDHNIRTGTYCCYEPDPADALAWAL